MQVFSWGGVGASEAVHGFFPTGATRPRLENEGRKPVSRHFQRQTGLRRVASCCVIRFDHTAPYASARLANTSVRSTHAPGLPKTGQPTCYGQPHSREERPSPRGHVGELDLDSRTTPRYAVSQNVCSIPPVSMSGQDVWLLPPPLNSKSKRGFFKSLFDRRRRRDSRYDRTFNEPVSGGSKPANATLAHHFDADAPLRERPRFDVPEAPSSHSLVKQFDLKARGRERGKNRRPSSEIAGLDSVETEVAEHCRSLFVRVKKAYVQRRDDLELTARAFDPARDAKAEGWVKQATGEMKTVVEESRAELSRIHKKAQDASNEVAWYREEHGLQELDVEHATNSQKPDKGHKALSWLLYLTIFGFVETLLNATFFESNMRGGFEEAFAQALFFSFINVGAIAACAALAYRHLRSSDNRMAGWTWMVLVIIFAVLWNAALAHYRDALGPEYPPQTSATVMIGDQDWDPSQCWVGDQAPDADAEAVCLFLNRWLRLHGILSYVVMAAGLAFCAGAVWKAWWPRLAPRPDLPDSYAGLLRRRREARKERQNLMEARRAVLSRVEVVHSRERDRQTDTYLDPVDAWNRSSRAQEELRLLHPRVLDFAKDLRQSCTGAIEGYRDANREVRTEAPQAWDDPWVADWTVPEPVDDVNIGTKEEAEDKSKVANESLQRRLRELRESVVECINLLNTMTRLDDA